MQSFTSSSSCSSPFQGRLTNGRPYTRTIKKRQELPIKFSISVVSISNLQYAEFRLCWEIYRSFVDVNEYSICQKRIMFLGINLRIVIMKWEYKWINVHQGNRRAFKGKKERYKFFCTGDPPVFFNFKLFWICTLSTFYLDIFFFLK